MCPPETVFQWILSCRPEGLNDFHGDVFLWLFTLIDIVFL
jgi:hypothetical protein